MGFSRAARILVTGTALLAVAGCGGGSFGSNPFGGGNRTESPEVDAEGNRTRAYTTREERQVGGRTTLAQLFGASADPNVTVGVNKYLWNASLDVLNFLPIESVDPFTGVIVTGYGAPPGGGRAYRATIYVQDPALDARSLRVALQARGGGAVSRETSRAIEDAILTRARQLRIQDRGL